MAVAALVTIAVWMVLVGAARGIAHARTGDGLGVRFEDRRGSPQWWARAIGSVGFVLLVLAPVAEFLGLRPIPVLDHLPLRAAGLGVAIAGIAGTLYSQSAMGRSWRGDVDPDVHTALVTDGPFRWIRNPIFTFSAITSTGVALMVPNVVALAMLFANFGTYNIQVRLVEEPYLQRVHGDVYRKYAERTGRFLPRFGRPHRPETSPDDLNPPTTWRSPHP
jgi:protein-S-isoprenylcysteine O-methyltransferase Ste14